ncbi:uncharacterized protein LOC126910429 [Daktulosphaira vitifoliae]|uniref:uncharacterized protein LOC126910429 n=1 Tax=Daktulosphaira vitifoliae TaxID=58002 RepID=UPI0021AA04E2|nr:uncharacterized protein LOC126910429 [Daktulosphaira vitifoliae]
MTNFYLSSVITILLSYDVVNSEFKSLPDYLHVCRRSQINISNCIIDSAYFLKNKIAEGIPEFDLAPLDPMVIDLLIPSGGRDIKIETTNLRVTGASNFTVPYLEADIKRQKYEFQVKFPHMHILGNYNLDGKIVRMAIKGQGDFDLDIDGVRSNVSMLGKITNIDGLNYIRFDNVTVKIGIDRGRIELRNLFGGDKNLGEIINTAINSNFIMFFTELRPIIQKVVEKLVMETVDKLTKLFTYEQLFPD